LITRALERLLETLDGDLWEDFALDPAEGPSDWLSMPCGRLRGSWLTTPVPMGKCER
jgi:hypothetical protein